MKKFLVTLTFLVCLQAHNQSVKDVFGAVPCLPEDVATKISNWLKEHDEVVKALVIQQGDLADYEKCHDANNVLLKQKNIKNLSRYNYVFECPVASDYMIKISGPINRLVNTVVSHGLWPSTITEDEVASMKKTATCQTISSFPAYLLSLRLSKVYDFKHVYIPKTYLLKVPGASDGMADTSYVIVQEKIDLLEKDQMNNVLTKLNANQVRELATTIAACGLWDIKNKIHVARDGHLVIVDLEQPNVSNNRRGFNIHDNIRFAQNVSGALNDLKDIVGSSYEKLIDECAEAVLK